MKTTASTSDQMGGTESMPLFHYEVSSPSAAPKNFITYAPNEPQAFGQVSKVLMEAGDTNAAQTSIGQINLIARYDNFAALQVTGKIIGG